ncbi:hypothetical protein UCRNP2_4483 [Neofusicoccum parvum UCRNP2]|uniref:Uncharacterized protein n=2 Tax=Neofusicoccum TaxID=407951 RepID=R1GRV7_BOTPV|nr:hypothetical protein UCRNP2_4483 [Neofusicoccum parvum UCRNP2]
MAEPEELDEDLFADLYVATPDHAKSLSDMCAFSYENDEGPSKAAQSSAAAAPQPVPVAPEPSSAAIPVANEQPAFNYNGAGAAPAGDGDVRMNGDEHHAGQEEQPSGNGHSSGIGIKEDG